MKPFAPKKFGNEIRHRFRGFLPVVIDVETSGLNPNTDAILEIAAVTLRINAEGFWERYQTFHEHVEPFPGANIDPEALRINGIDPDHPFRYAVTEKQALKHVFGHIDEQLSLHRCQRAVLVGHNAWFDLLFIKAAAARSNIKKSPLHNFTTFDTATLGGLAYGQTVLAKACIGAKIPFNQEEAHSAIYDAEKTADLFCKIVNTYSASAFSPK